MRTAILLLSSLLMLPTAVLAQPEPPRAAQAVVPRLIRFSGQVRDASGTVGITFSLHKSLEDHASLWMETQSVPLDSTGKYNVLLGATKAEGIPMDLFLSGEAQWLAVQVEGKPEQPRVLLVSVPYALKAAEAETLAGHAVSEFVTTDKLTTAVQQQMQTNTLSTPPAAGNQLTTSATAAGATNFNGNTIDQIVKVTQSNTTGSGLVATAPAIAIKGTSTATTGTPSGVRGLAASPGGAGVLGSNSAITGGANGVHGSSASPAGSGVFGNNTATTGNAIGVRGTSVSKSGIAILGSNTSTSGTTIGVKGTAVSTEGGVGVFGDGGSSGFGVRGQGLTGVEAVTTQLYGTGLLATASGGGTAAVLVNYSGQEIISGQSGNPQTEVFSVASSGQITTAGGLSSARTIAASGNPAVLGAGGTGVGVAGTGGLYGVQGTSSGIGVYGHGDSYGVEGFSSGTGVYGSGDSKGVSGLGNSYGVYGTSSGTGVYGQGGSSGVSGYSALSYGTGVLGTSEGANGAGVSGSGTDGEGLYGYDNNAGYGILAGVADTTDGYAGWFNGNVEVDGTLSKAAGSFKIDDPLDPANKYLYHSFVESPDMKNMYDGTVTTDAQGNASVEMPRWFEALNRDFRYQLTVIGEFAQAMVASKIQNNRFTIKTDRPNVEVSWLVTGVRRDAYANAHRIPVEVEKPANERGTYLHPELFGGKEEQGVLWGRHPEAMKRLKDARQHASQPAAGSPTHAAASGLAQP